MRTPVFPFFKAMALVFAALFAAFSCDVRPREDIRWVDYSVPALAHPDCANELVRVLTTVEGIVEVNLNLPERSVSIQYNSRVLAQKNIEHAIAGGGFDVSDTPGDPTAKSRLPAPCQ